MKVILMAAVTLDGKIAKTSQHFPDWTSKEDKQFFKKESLRHGVVIMGSKTFSTFPAPLPGRLNVVFTSQKSLPPQKGVLWATGDPGTVLKELKKKGYQSAVLGGGAHLNTLFLKKGLIDEIIVTIEPKIFGEGLSLFDGDFNVNLELTEMSKINDNSVVLRYNVKK